MFRPWCGVLFAMGKTKSFYAVRVGRNVGVYESWSECEAQVKRFPGAVYKGFATSGDAETFVGGSGGHVVGGATPHGGQRGSGYSSGGGYGSSGYNSHRSGTGHSSSGYSKAGSTGYSGAGCSKAGSTGYSGAGYSKAGGTRHGSTARQRYAGDFTLSRYSGSSGSGYGSHRGGSSYTASSSSIDVTTPVVYSDGCCYNNGRRGACGGVGVYWGEGSQHNVSEKLDGGQTNQRAELVSACRALEGAIDQGYGTVELRTDSSYTINAMTSWVSKWKRNGWKTSADGDVKNKPDLVRLDGLCQRINVKWTHVPGHRGIHGNEAADQLAKAGSQK